MNPTSVPFRSTASLVAAAFLISGLVALDPLPAPASAVPLGDDAEFFDVSQSGSGVSSQPYLTGDGQKVFFRSTASDLVPGDTNGVADVFLSTAIPGSGDPFSGTPRIVSLPDASLSATAANGASGEPVASSDGRYVAFTSSATNLVPGTTTPGRTHVYVRDTLLGTTVRPQYAGVEPNGDAFDLDLSDDGRYLVFSSTATNLSAGDVNGVADVFLVDFDHDEDGVRNSVVVERVYPQTSLAAGSSNGRISGNGGTLMFLSRNDPMGVSTSTSPTATIVQTAPGGWTSYGTWANDVTSFDVDATGGAIAYISSVPCNSVPHVFASTRTGANMFTVAVGLVNVETRTGEISDPVISADGSRIAWTTTRPAFDYSGVTPALAHPIVRMQEVSWPDANTDSIECSGIMAHEWVDVAEGTQPSVSVSGRTVAFGTPDATPARVRVVDTHIHDGLAVTSQLGAVVTPGFMTSLSIANIPVASIRDYASAVANAPIHRLPIHRLPIHRLPIHRLPIHRLLIDDAPIHRLPIHRLPIHRLPIHRLDLPGGWAQVLEGSPFAGDLVQTVTLDEVLTWAKAQVATGATPTPAQLAAAERILSLTLADVGIDESGLDALTIASYLLGDAHLEDITIAGTVPGNLPRWQALVTGQGIDLTLDGLSVLAEADAAGLDVSRTGISDVPLRSLPIDDTLLDAVSVVGTTDAPGLFLAGTPLGDVTVASLTAAGRDALFGTDAVTGTLAAPSQPIRTQATAADLARAVPTSVTFGTLLLSVLDTENYPWEQIPASAMNPRLADTSTVISGCTGTTSCWNEARFRFSFDAGPGEDTRFTAPEATITLPAGTNGGTASVSGTSPGVPKHITEQSWGTLIDEGRLQRYALDDTNAGTMLEFTAGFQESTQVGASELQATLASGGRFATASRWTNTELSSYDDPKHNLVDGAWENLAVTLEEGKLYYEWISPAWLDTNEQGLVEGPAEDEDYYLVRAPEPGKRLVVSTNATDGQIAMSLYAPTRASASTLGVANAGAAPGTLVTEQSGQGSPAESGADAGVSLAGQTLLDQAVVSGDGAAEVEAASVDAAIDDRLVLRVTSGNGLPSSALYSLRVRYVDEPAEGRCLAYSPAHTGAIGASTAVTADTNTLYVIDAQRYDQVHGTGAADTALAALQALGGVGGVDSAVLAVDSDADVRAQRTELDKNPCAMSQRAKLTAEINRFVTDTVEASGADISSIVIVGGDDVIPLAPVAQHTAQFTEASHAGDLRRTTTPTGDACPAVAEGTADPCETPLSAAARGSFVLTDDPYALASAYTSMGGYLYVPTVGIGRLTGDPTEIAGVAARFAAAGGILDADSSTTAGYGAWSELPETVGAALNWRVGWNSQVFPEVWTKSLLEASVFPGGTGAQSARVVSINTHADEKRMLPGVEGADAGVFADQDLFLADGRTDAAQLTGALVFLIGCHAGNNLPAGYYGADATDWVDVFSAAGGYVGNTGFGLANNVTTALSERLLTLYAEWIGVQKGDRTVTSAEALAYAKQAYLGGLGLYSGYDEKVLMQAVYYGLPMYTFAESATPKSAPLPQIPADLGAPATDGPLLTASLSLHPSFTTSSPDADGRTYVTADGQAPAVVAGQPILPKVVSQLDSRPAGFVPRGALLTGLTSQTTAASPAIAAPDVGVDSTTATRSAVAFPSTFASISSQQTPTGPVDLLVVTPARVTAPAGGAGQVETFTDLEVEVTYGHANATDTTAPVLRSAEVGTGISRFQVDDGDDGSGVHRLVLLVQREGSSAWQRVDVTGGSGGRWIAETPDVPFRWILQMVDKEGNVSTESSRGHLDVAGAAAPELGAIGDDVPVKVGDRVTRTVVVGGVAAGQRATASVKVTTPEGSLVRSTPATVLVGADGMARVTLDERFDYSGEFVVTLTACLSGACDDASFAVVATDNAPPTVSVTLTSDRLPIDATATLTADATGSDPEDGATVALQYAWTRNGVALDLPATTTTLPLAGLVEYGDTFAVRVTPRDSAGLVGHSSTAQLAVAPTSGPPADPTITATAKAGTADYAEGAWSTVPVTVTFTCTSGLTVTTCPAAATVSTDTTAAGTTVSGTMTDSGGRTASASVTVKVDTTAPTLAPTVTPNPVLQGGVATATPNAADAASGVVSQSCDVPATTVTGVRTVDCRATDAAGNTATVAASYVVQAPPPAAKTCRGLLDRAALPPVNADGSSVFARSSAVPVIFRACDAKGKSIGTKGFVKSVTQVSTTSLPSSARINELWYLPLTTSFTYVSLTETWVGAISTTKLAAGKKYTYKVTLTDGTSFTLSFGVR